MTCLVSVHFHCYQCFEFSNSVQKNYDNRFKIPNNIFWQSVKFLKNLLKLWSFSKFTFIVDIFFCKCSWSRTIVTGRDLRIQGFCVVYPVLRIRWISMSNIDPQVSVLRGPRWLLDTSSCDFMWLYLPSSQRFFTRLVP